MAFKQSEFPSVNKNIQNGCNVIDALTDLNVTNTVDQVTNLIGLSQV